MSTVSENTLIEQIELYVITHADAEMNHPEFKFKCVGEEIASKWGRDFIVPILPADLKKTETELSGRYQREIAEMKKRLEYLRETKVALANIQDVMRTIDQRPLSGMCVGVHSGALAGVKPALKELRNKVRYYKPMEATYGGGRGEVQGIWHIIMDQDSATKCKMFGWLEGFGIELCNLSDIAWAEYNDPQKFIRKG